MTWEIRQGDALERLREMPDESVQCCVTSPPYFGLRDYGVEGQLGLEATPDEYVAAMVDVFREVRRVLRADGTLWLNIGDSYNNADKWGGGGANTGKHTRAPDGSIESWKAVRRRWGGMEGTKPKDLLGIPWLLAFALRADGWYLRSDIIWAKPNPMPESVTDRPTSAHEHVFLLARSARYFYCADAIAEDSIHAGKTVSLGEKSLSVGQSNGANVARSGNALVDSVTVTATRNKRNVWEIATQPYAEAHFATFPPKLVEPCILAGSRPNGALIEPEYVDTPTGERVGDDPSMTTGRAGMNRPRGENEGARRITVVEQRAYAEQLRQSDHRAEMEAQAGTAFAHYLRTDASGARPVPASLLERWIHEGWVERVRPPAATAAEASTAVVLDPFCGSGTTGVVALRRGRSFVGIELNPAYVQLARRRIQDDAPLLNTPAEVAA